MSHQCCAQIPNAVDRDRRIRPDEARHASTAVPSIGSASGRASPNSEIRRPSLYNTGAWKRERLEHLRNWPWCVLCLEQGRKTPATVVDHKKPHRGDTKLFFDRTNWQSLCKCCHDGAKQRFEKSGVMVGSNVSGMPLDKAHHWNTESHA